MKKLLLILVVAFAGIVSFSYANSLTNISSEVSVQPTCPTSCGVGVELHKKCSSDNTYRLSEYFDSFALYQDNQYYYIKSGDLFCRCTLVSNSSWGVYRVSIKNTTYYFQYRK